MRLLLERTGGFAPPAMHRRCAVDSASLSEADARELASLVTAADVFNLEPAAAAPQARDPFHYRLTIEADGRRQTIETSDVTMPANLRVLVRWLLKRCAPGDGPR